MDRTFTNLRKNQKKLSTLCFILFSGWLLSVPFEGQVLYSLMEQANANPYTYILPSILSNALGLSCCGFFIKNQMAAKTGIIVSILICISGSLLFFIYNPGLWMIALILMSFFGGVFISSMGFYVYHYSLEKERHKTIADMLIYSNILMILCNVIAVNLSAWIAIGFSILLLVVSLFFSFHLEAYLDDQNLSPKIPLSKNEISPSMAKPFFVLCIFIAAITITSGLMYQVVTPSFAHLEVFASYYWAFPYILALIILRNLPKSMNQAYILYMAIMMIGLSFIAFMCLDKSIFSYLIIDTLMLGAFGVCDLFWWSILVRFFDYVKNPAQFLGIGLSMNVFGILLGGYIGNHFLFEDGNHTTASIIALSIIFIVLMILPLLYVQLTKLFANHVFLIKFSGLREDEQKQTLSELKYYDLLTKKEIEVVNLLLKGYTYKRIAQTLFISENTIKFHTKNIYHKLQVNSKMELITLFSDIDHDSL